MPLVEWLAAILTLLQIHLYPRHLAAGICMGIAGSALWMASGVLHEMWALVALNGLIIVFHMKNRRLGGSGSAL